ncbi:MAG TPA: hypothetical protein VJB95_01125 [Candidatus Paceibacterota bacterium]
MSPKKELVLAWFLGFVVLWFGYKEVTGPNSWTAMIPSFLGVEGQMAVNLVMAHGIILILSGLALVFNFHRRIAASVIALLILAIVGNFLMTGGLSAVAVRDIGLLGMALALAL